MVNVCYLVSCSPASCIHIHRSVLQTYLLSTEQVLFLLTTDMLAAHWRPRWCNVVVLDVLCCQHSKLLVLSNVTERVKERVRWSHPCCPGTSRAEEEEKMCSVVNVRITLQVLLEYVSVRDDHLCLWTCCRSTVLMSNCFLLFCILFLFKKATIHPSMAFYRRLGHHEILPGVDSWRILRQFYSMPVGVNRC